MIPKAALDYLKRKTNLKSFSYKDVWREEHATAFTVAKSVHFDVLADIHNAVNEAMRKGQTFATFKKNLQPLLEQKGWTGHKKMTDPVTGKDVEFNIDIPRRLKTIYRVNMRSAYQKGQWDRTQASDMHPYLMYRIGPSVHHREDHANWDGLILPKDDPWWDSHFPPNGWGCKCYTRAVTEARKERYEKDGVPVPPRVDGTGGGRIAARTQAPPTKYKMFFNERKLVFEKVPEGVDPAFNWNQGKAATRGADEALRQARENYARATRNIPALTDKEEIAVMQEETNTFYKSLASAPPERRDSLDFYSSGRGANLNSLLNKPGNLWQSAPEATAIKNLDEAMAKFPPLAKETYFFKGDEARWWVDAAVGEEHPLKGYLSTSARKKVAEEYAGFKRQPLMVIVRAPAGSRGLYFGNKTLHKTGNEYEWLFPRGQRFKVLDKNIKAGYIMIEALK